MLLLGSRRKPAPQYLPSSLNMPRCCYSAYLFDCLCSLCVSADMLVSELSSGFWQGRPEGGGSGGAPSPRLSLHFLHAAKKQRAKAPSGIGPDGAGTQRRFLGSHDSASSRAECVIAGSITRVSTGRLLRHSSRDSARGSRGGAREVMNILQLGLRASLQGCTFPAATRTATIGRCSAIRAGGSAGASTSMAGSWWAPGSMATLTAVGSTFKSTSQSLHRYEKKRSAWKWTLRVIIKTSAHDLTSALLKTICFPFETSDPFYWQYRCFLG